jgi:hypothetical protein
MNFAFYVVQKMKHTDGQIHGYDFTLCISLGTSYKQHLTNWEDTCKLFMFNVLPTCGESNMYTHKELWCLQLQNKLFLFHSRWSRRHRHGAQGSQRRDIVDYRTGYIRSHLRSPSGRVRWPDPGHSITDLDLWLHSHNLRLFQDEVIKCY